jgi:hypothetical protein
MGRRLGLLAAALAVLAAGCSGTAGSHWRRSSGAQTLVTFQILPSARIDTQALETVGARWTKSSTVAIRFGDCPAGGNCVPIYGEARNGGLTSVGADSHRHIHTGNGTWIRLDNRLGQTWVNQLAVACHELALSLGLTETTADGGGPCDAAGNPTAWDLWLVTRLHAHTDTSGPPGA